VNKIKYLLDDARKHLLNAAEAREERVWVDRADHADTIWVGSVQWQMGDFDLALAQVFRAVAVCIPGKAS